MSEPREFWFIYYGDGLGGNGREAMIFTYKDEAYNEQYGLTHVIEYSAYEEMKHELTERSNALVNLRKDWLEAREDLTKANDKIIFLEKLIDFISLGE